MIESLYPFVPDLEQWGLTIARFRPLHAYLVCLSAVLFAGLAPPAHADAPSAIVQTVAVIVGAPGTPEYERQFGEWAERWRQAVEQSGNQYVEFGRDSTETAHRDAIKAFVTRDGNTSQPLWLVFIGHGTHFRETSNFNLRGPDISATDLKEWLDKTSRPIVIVNCASSSGPFINALSATNRVVITATKSGTEQNFSRFGDYISAAITDPAADLDHDDRVSLLEAYLSASARVAKFYENENRLATEHALLDDNGDGLGTPATFYRGVHAVKSPKDGAAVDRSLSARIGLQPSAGQEHFSDSQRRELAELEQQLEALRATKAAMVEDEYYRELESLMIRVARLYASVE